MPVREHWKLLLGRGSRRASSSQASDQRSRKRFAIGGAAPPRNGRLRCASGAAEKSRKGRASTPPFVASMLEEATGCSETAPTVAPPAERGVARTLTRVRFLGSGLVAAAGALGGYAAQAQAARDRTGVGPRSLLGATHGVRLLGVRIMPRSRLQQAVRERRFSRFGSRASVLQVPCRAARAARRGRLRLALPRRRRTGIGRPAPSVGAGRLHARAPMPGKTVLVGRGKRRPLRSRRPRRARPCAHPSRRQRPAGALRRHRLRADPDCDARDHPPGPDRRAPGHPGRERQRRLKLLIPAKTKAGPARLRVRMRNAAGTTTTVTRGIQIPHA